ncbi:ABC transporter permease [Hymenobacter properus]|uniref:ABC transporter permease n=1 Tax=Hymenobacter properus TaxID=2791026 RepID=A0A931BL16_9BACT|nr:ABC transporter permease [Hymenobacter properus]MBF9141415.1 ABC transporter permease [Hymenobacter properus]MBR7720224.1 ABC transporter permease [Microvirga sp. SRT04]
MAAIIPPSAFRLPRWAAAWLGLLGLLAVAAPVLPLPYPPHVPDLAHIAQAPLGPGQHWLGTDPQGRDVLSLLVFGTRTAVLLTLPAALLAAVLGALLGGVAGYWGNRTRVAVPYWAVAAGAAWWVLRLPAPWLGPLVGTLGLGSLVAGGSGRRVLAWRVPLDGVVMAGAATLDTVPRLVLVVALAASTGSISALGLLVLLTVTSWPSSARLVRAQMLRVRALPFVEAAQAAGLPAWRIWLKHAMPHAISPLRTTLPLSLATLLGLESTLSFLGIGLPPEVASWGRLMASYRQDTDAWWLFLFPSIMLTISIISLNKLAKYRT